MKPMRIAYTTALPTTAMAIERIGTIRVYNISNDQVTKVLELAKTKLEQPGFWFQGDLYNYDDDEELIGACVMGCVHLATDELSNNTGYKYELGNAALDRIINANEMDEDAESLTKHVIAEFNDDPATTVEDAIFLVKKAIYG